jgi:hypothetical protein
MSVATAETSSYIPPDIAWARLGETFALEISLADKDLVEFISEGSLRVIQYGSRKVAKVTSLLLGDSLFSRLIMVASSHPKVFPRDLPREESREVEIYFHGAFCIPGESRVLVLAGANPCDTNMAVQLNGLVEKAKKIFQKYERELAEFDKETEKKKEEQENLYLKMPELRDFDYGLAEQERMRHRPIATAEALASDFPKAVCFPLGRKTNLDRISREALSEVSKSGWRPSRNGEYQAFNAVDPEGKKLAGLYWEPYLGFPPYPEVRWTVIKRLPSARKRPELTSPSRPVHDLNRVSPTSTFWTDEEDAWQDALTDIQFDDIDFNERVSATRDSLGQDGFEAIAWFQPFHVWSEESWGIYIDAAKLDDLALTISSESRNIRFYTPLEYCAQLAFGLIYSHEFFHARVEASLSWLEVNTLGSKYLRYTDNVYKHFSGTDDWLEESLANWSSWNWHQKFVHASAASSKLDCDKLNQLVESLLDLSPPGYNNWRCGHHQSSWRLLTTQMVSGKAAISHGRLLPLESLLAENLPYDLQKSDIPIFFVGNGTIADRLQAHPAVLNVPTRKELERALRYFSYVVKGNEGKGSHQKWVGPDNRPFTLPKRDPVSRGVFKTFLEHFNLDKMTYAHEIRPKL